MAALQFASFADDPRLTEKAARFPCFGARNLAEARKLSRVLSSQSLMEANNGKRVTISDVIMEKPRFSGRVSYSSSLGALSMSDSLVTIGTERNGRKRKATPKCQGKISPLSSPNMNPPKEGISGTKKCKLCEGVSRTSMVAGNWEKMPNRLSYRRITSISGQEEGKPPTTTA